MLESVTIPLIATCIHSFIHEGSTHIWHVLRCAAQVSKPLPTFTESYVAKYIPIFRDFL